MGCLGVHYALEPETAARLVSAANDEARMGLIEEIEEGGSYDNWHCDTDKAWDAIHRCLTNGKLEWNNGQYPLNLAILGGKRLYEGDEYIICLIELEEVPKVASALVEVTQEGFYSGYEQIPANEYDAIVGSEDFEYAWGNFLELPKFFEKAALAGRVVIFTTDL